MRQPFDPPISTSNLYAPDSDRLGRIFESAFDHRGHLVIGSLVSTLEEKLREYHHAEHCVCFSTGFWALVAAVRIRSRQDSPDVIIPSLTYRRLADVVYWAGKTPVMVDCEANNLAVSCPAVIDAINESTALILAVHPIVNCCDVNELLSIAAKHEIPIVFDAVESVHESIEGQRIGSFGVGEVFSFHASKLINGLEGGYVCTDDRNFADQLRRFRSGSREYDNKETGVLGINGIMCDGHAAFALAGLEEIETNVAHNREIYETYQRELANVPGIRLLRFDEREQTSFKNIVAEVTPQYGIDRDELVRQLNAKGILARAHYDPALHAKLYAYSVQINCTTNADGAMKRFINLPCGQMVNKDDIAKTCRLLKSDVLQSIANT